MPSPGHRPRPTEWSSHLAAARHNPCCLPRQSPVPVGTACQPTAFVRERRAEYVRTCQDLRAQPQVRADAYARLQNGRSVWLSDTGGSEHGAADGLAGADGEAGEEDRWRSAASSWRWYWRASTPGSFSAGAVPVPVERGHRMFGDVPGQHREKITARR